MQNFWHDLLFFCRFARSFYARFAKQLDIANKVEYNENSELCAARGKEWL